MDKIIIISMSCLPDLDEGKNLRDITLSDFPFDSRIFIRDADVLIVFDDNEAKVLTNLLSDERLDEIMIANLPGYVTSKIYRLDGRKNQRAIR